MKHNKSGFVFAVAALLMLAVDAVTLPAQVNKQSEDLPQQTDSKGTAVPEPKIDWQKGPVKAKLGDIAEINLPAGYVFADLPNTNKFLELTHNIPSGRELGTVGDPASGWFAIFEFNAVGYVKDDEKDKLDADKLLKSIQEATEEANKARKERGWGTFTVTSWIDPPHYDSRNNQLSWSLVGQDEKGSQSANYMTRALGRRGVMEITLITDPQKLATALPRFQTIAGNGFGFTPENKYSAFVKGDKVAEYGLSALILGGAAAVAVKTGLFKYLLKLAVVGWKFIVLGFGAFVAFLKRLFTGRKASSEETTAATGPTSIDV